MNETTPVRKSASFRQDYHRQLLTYGGRYLNTPGVEIEVEWLSGDHAFAVDVFDSAAAAVRAQIVDGEDPE